MWELRGREALKPALGVSRLPGRNVIQKKHDESELAVRNEDKRILAKGEAEVRPLIERGVLEDRVGHCIWRTECGFCGDQRA